MSPKRKRGSCTSSRCQSYGSTVYSRSSVTSVSQSCTSVGSNSTRDTNYQRVKKGVRDRVPAAIVLWAFHKLPGREGLTSRRVINFIKKNYQFTNRAHGRSPGKSIGTMLRCAEEFGLIQKRGNRYFLNTYKKSDRHH